MLFYSIKLRKAGDMFPIGEFMKTRGLNVDRYRF